MRRTALVLWLLVAGCRPEGAGDRVTLRFWGLGREGEVVADLARRFETENPAIRVQVQQIPWSAAHEKLLTAFVGRSTPDVAQIGNTWIPEFAALSALTPLTDLLARPGTLAVASYFPGIWDTNVIDGEPFGIPWYVDTRVIFYRKDLLARAGYDSIPATWEGWRTAMAATKRVAGPDKYAILLPLNEWPPPVILGLQAGSTLLADHDTRGAFSGPEFRTAFAFYLSLFRDGLAPPVVNTQIANLYQEFARGSFSMYITGPWNLGEFRSRLPPELKDAWGTSPLPGPDASTPGVSLAGGASLVLFRGSRHKEEAWRFVEFLSRPENQVEFFRVTGDLPARREAWADTALTSDPNAEAFRKQLQHVVPTPKIPEWELIATRIQERVEVAVRGGVEPDSVLAALDRDVARILEKRRWLLEHSRRESAAGREATP